MIDTVYRLGYDASINKGYRDRDMSSFKIRNMGVANYCMGFTTWYYNATGATYDDVTSAGFFNWMKDMLKLGDVIMISHLDTGHNTIVSVFANNGNNVITAKLV